MKIYIRILLTCIFLAGILGQNVDIERVNFNFEILNQNRDNVCMNAEKYGFSERVGTKKYFLISDRLMKWNDGEMYCQSFGAHLPVIRNQDENNYLRTFIGNRVWSQAEYSTTLLTHSGFWLGAYKSVETNTFKWVDNSPWLYTNWKSNEPNFEGKIQFYVHDLYTLNTSEYEGWDDESDLIHSFVICQLDCSTIQSNTTITTTVNTPSITTTTISTIPISINSSTIVDTTTDTTSNICITSTSSTSTVSSTTTDTTTLSTTTKPLSTDIFNYKLNTTFTKYGYYNFTKPWGIAIVFSNQTNYIYATDWYNEHIIVFKQNDDLIQLKNQINPDAIVSSNRELFVSDVVEKSITKYDLNLNLIKKISNCSFIGSVSGQCLMYPVGLFYDLNTNVLYSADRDAHGVHVFDNDLKRVNFVHLTSHDPFSVLYFNNKLYVGTRETNKIFVIQNNTITSTHNNICMASSYIESIQLYNQQYLLFSCLQAQSISIYNLNMTSTSKYLYTSGKPLSVALDSSNRIFVTIQNPSGIDVFVN